MTKPAVGIESVRNRTSAVPLLNSAMLCLSTVILLLFLAGATGTTDTGLIHRVDFIEKSGVILVGTIVPYAGESLPPNCGWLLCNGSDIPSGNEYEELRKMFGKSVPDMRGLTVYGAGKDTPFREGVGSNYVKLGVSNLPYHDLAMTEANDSGVEYGLTASRGYSGRVVVTASSPAPKELTRDPEPVPTMSPGYGLNWIVRYGAAKQ